jgi:spore germination protein YaaH
MPMKSGWLSASLISLTTLSIEGPATRGPFHLGVWLTYWDLDRGVSRLATPAGREVRDVFLFSAALDTGGRVILVEDPDATASLVSDLEARGSRVWLTIVNDVHPEGSEARPVLKDAGAIHRILSDPRLVREHRGEIVDLARKLGVSGVDIDYENLDPRDRDLFTSFAAALSSALGREQVLLSVTAQPKERESSSVGPGALDWGALCNHVDRLQIMLYNQHSAKTGPGPMATPEWIGRVLRFGLEECARTRIVPVLKVSGMEWSKSGTRGVQYEECMELLGKAATAVSRDDADRVPHFTYAAKDGPATIFFEDALSIETKVDVIRNLGLEAVVLWSLGREDPEILSRIAS